MRLDAGLVFAVRRVNHQENVAVGTDLQTWAVVVLAERRMQPTPLQCWRPGCCRAGLGSRKRLRK